MKDAGIESKTVVDKEGKMSGIRIIVRAKESESISIKDTEQSSSTSGSNIPDIAKREPEGWISLFLKNDEKKIRGVPTKKKSHYSKRSLYSIEMTNITSSCRSLQLASMGSAILNDLDINDPDLDVLKLGPENLELFVMKIMNTLDYFRKCTISQPELFDNFLSELHQNYQIHQNPFHNFIHGVNVMHGCYLFMTNEKNQKIFSTLKQFGIVFSGLCHDVGHTGFANGFEISSRSEKALTYNDLSPLENFHASRTFIILRKPSNNFMQKLPIAEMIEFRKDVISNILNTDIKEHFPMLKKFETLRSEPNSYLSGRSSLEPSSFTPTAEELTLLSGMVVHASDFAGSVKELAVSKEWSTRVNKEFSNQYEEQGRQGLPQTPFMKDLHKEEILVKNQLGFLKVIVMPLYKTLQNFYEGDSKLGKLCENLNSNVAFWEELQNLYKQSQP